MNIGGFHDAIQQPRKPGSLYRRGLRIRPWLARLAIPVLGPVVRKVDSAIDRDFGLKMLESYQALWSSL